MEILGIVIIGLTLISMILSIVFDWKIKIKSLSFSLYWVICLIGAIILLCFGLAGENPITNIFFNSASINPLKILVLFLSCASLSVLLDQIGFFSYLASIVLKKSKQNQIKLFFSFYFVIAILTIFTSNDILILTFTPFICYFAKHAKIDATPYIIAEFVGANTWSIFFLIGNPTNIYMGTSFGITFIEYALKMAIPTICCGLISILIIFALFRKKLKQPLSVEDVNVEKPDRTLLTIGLTGLILAIVLMSVANYIGLELWYIPLACCSLTYILVLVALLIKKQKLNLLWGALQRLPYSLIPFLLSMSIFVAVINNTGIISSFGDFISTQNIIVVGIISLLLGNLLNNIPMTMLMTTTLASFASSLGYVYGVIATSNICAILTPIGSLAGIMFMKILKNNEVKYSFKDFFKYGIIISIPTLLASLLLITLI
ncbi:MAG: hypothetical protein J5689_00835 [Clostridia bacterium]|nr:hypothetical protein [Clostridia bacterium]